VKINDVLITNWKPPGPEWWDNVKASPDEELIETEMKLKLSWREYQALTKADKGERHWQKHSPNR